MSFQLRLYQQQALDAIGSAIAAGSGRVLVALPTGTGKTAVMSHLPKALDVAGRTLVLAHRDELLDQAAVKFRKANPCHAVAPSYRAVFEHLGCFERLPRMPLVGFTATPTRGDGVGLASVFEAIAFQKDLAGMIEQGWLCPIAGYRVRSEADLEAVRVRAGDFAQGQLAQAVDTDDRNAVVVAAGTGPLGCRLLHLRSARSAALRGVCRCRGIIGRGPREKPRDARRDATGTTGVISDGRRR